MFAKDDTAVDRSTPEQLTAEVARGGSENKSAEEIRLTLDAARALSFKKWQQARVMLVGEGRAGKTAVANSISGKGYQDTHSTIGTMSIFGGYISIYRFAPQVSTIRFVMFSMLSAQQEHYHGTSLFDPKRNMRPHWQH